MTIKFLISAFVFCLIHLGTIAVPLSQTLPYTTISNEDGLSQNSVYDIVQDQDGYIWFALNNGINRYDGHNIKEYLPGEGSKSFGNWTTRLYVDSRNTLWILTYDGLGVYDRQNDEVVNINYITGQNADMRQVLSVRELSNGSILFSSTNGIYRFSYDSLKYYPLQINGSERFNENHITSIEELDNGLLLFVGMYTVFEVDMAKHKAVQVFSVDKPENSEFVSNYTVKETLKDSNGDIWIFTFPGIHYKYEYRNRKVTKLKMPVDYLFHDAIYETDSTFLMSVDIYGLLRYSIPTGTFSKLNGNNRADGKIENNKIQVLYIDRQNILWMGHSLSGVSYSLLDQNYFTTINQTAYPELFPVVSGVLKDSKNRLWIGTDGGGLFLLDSTKNLIAKFVENKRNYRSLQSNAVLAITEDSNHTIWVGTYSGGLAKYCEASNDFDVYQHNKSYVNGLPTNDIRQILEDSQGDLWLVTHGTGLTKLNRKNGMYTYFQMGLEGENKILNDWTFQMLFDRDDDLLIVGSRGLSVYDTTSKKFHNYSKRLDNGNGLTSDMIFTLCQDSKGRIWCGTGKGLHQFFKHKGAFQLASNQSRLAHVSVNSIAEDNQGYLWLGTSKGLFRYHPDTREEKMFLKSDLIQGNEFVKNSVYKDPDGVLYFGGTEGLTYFDPEQIQMNTVPPVAKITQINVMGSKIANDDFFTGTLRLPYNRNFITIQFAALNFINPHKNQYTYKLDGLEKDWHQATHETKAVYTSLPPGEYVFKNKACNNDGVWNDTPTELSLIIDPHWSGTWWFRILASIIASALVLLIYYMRVRNIKATNRMLEQKVAERTGELTEVNEELQVQKEEIEVQRDKLEELNKTKDKFFSIISHDLRNPLSAMIGFTDLLNRSFDRFPEEKKKKIIAIIAGSSKNLYALLENLLNWARSQSGAMPFTPEFVTVNDIIEDVFSTLSYHAEKKKIVLDYRPSSEITLVADQNMLSTVIRNLTSNAIKFTDPGGAVSMAVQQDDRKTTITVQDSGVGIPSDKIDTLFYVDKNKSTTGTEGEAGTGLGLILCREFIEKHRGKIWVESVHGQGSTFFIELPNTQ